MRVFHNVVSIKIPNRNKPQDILAVLPGNHHPAKADIVDMYLRNSGIDNLRVCRHKKIPAPLLDFLKIQQREGWKGKLFLQQKDMTDNILKKRFRLFFVANPREICYSKMGI